MTLSPNGGIFGGADLNANSDFVVIHTVVDVATGNRGAGDAQKNLEKVMGLIQTKVNVKYISLVSEEVDLSDADVRAVYGLGSSFNAADTVVHTLKFMTEQSKFIDAVVVADLLEGVAVAGAISAIETEDAVTKNISITIHDLF